MQGIVDSFVARWEATSSIKHRARIVLDVILLVLGFPILMLVSLAVPEKMSSLGYTLHLRAHAGRQYLEMIDELRTEYQDLSERNEKIVKRILAMPKPTEEGVALVLESLELDKRRVEIAHRMNELLDKARDA